METMTTKTGHARIRQVQIGTRQQMILKCIWKLGGESTIPAITECMQENYNSTLSGQAMNTMLILMTEKGLVERGTRKSHAYQYRALINEQDYRDAEVAQSYRFTFDGSASEMVRSLLKTEIPPEELKKMRAVLRGAKKD